MPSARGATTRRNAASCSSSAASASSCSVALAWAFFQRMQHRSASLRTPSSPDGPVTSSAAGSLILCPSVLQLPRSRAQKAARSPWSSRNRDARDANSGLLSPASDPACAGAARNASASSSSSLSSISTRTGPGGLAEAGPAATVAPSRRPRASLSAARVFSSMSRASLSLGNSCRASSRSATASLHMCSARSAVARRMKALKHASALLSKPSSKISAYSITLLHDSMASRQRKTLSSASALLVQSALQSLRYSRPSSYCSIAPTKSLSRMQRFPRCRNFSAVPALSTAFFRRDFMSASMARNSGLSRGTMGSPSSSESVSGSQYSQAL
mmetsp:Transcript_93799/g.265282  ORF Transcript_93799/g.265282 Transcript_93799/m.265282 type:complete len:329 (+) Transcript_93799:1552-2538(+)